MIVYGTSKDCVLQREAAEHLREKLVSRWNNYPVPIKADSGVSEGGLRNHHLLVVGRPNSNAIAGRIAVRLLVQFGTRSFVQVTGSIRYALVRRAR